MKTVVYLIAGLVIGILITLGIQQSPSSDLLIEKESRYNFEQTIARLEESAKTLEWRMPAMHDMQKILAGAGHEITQMRIYELCKPAYAYEMVKDDRTKKAAALLPCRIAVYEKSDGKTYFALTDMEQMGQWFQGEVSQTIHTVHAEIDQLINPLID